MVSGAVLSTPGPALASSRAAPHADQQLVHRKPAENSLPARRVVPLTALGLHREAEGP
jgi:hypothetical protein